MNEMVNVRMLDLFSGLGGASRAMKERGWQVTTVDNNPAFNPNILANILTWEYTGERPDLIWASPPCQEFSKDSLPLSWACNRKNPPAPDVGLMLAAKRIIDEAKPRYWVIENVAGARRYFTPYLGKYRKKVGSRYLWGDFPLFDTSPKYEKWKLPPTTDRAAKRSEIPKGISLALALAIEQEIATKMKTVTW